MRLEDQPIKITEEIKNLIKKSIIKNGTDKDSYKILISNNDFNKLLTETNNIRKLSNGKLWFEDCLLIRTNDIEDLELELLK